MYSLQLSLINFRSVQSNTFQDYLSESITLRYGPLQSDLNVVGGFGGKRILFQMKQEQLLQLLCKYSLGLFFKNNNGKYFCLLSLEKLDIQKCAVQNFEIKFFNEERNKVYQAKATIQLRQYKVRTLNKQNNIMHNLMHHQTPQKRHQQHTINSFLYGKQNSSKPITNKSSNKNKEKQQEQLKVPINSTNMNKNNHIYINRQLKTQQNFINNQENKINPYAKTFTHQFKVVQYSIQDDQQDNPPIMQFTNNGEQQCTPYSINIQPIVNTGHFTKKQKISIENTIQKQNSNIKTNQYGRQSPKFNTVQQLLNNTGGVTKSQKILNNQSSTSKKNINKISKNELKKYAQEFAAQNLKGHEIMIPIIKGNSYELVNINNLTKQQIIQYAKNHNKEPAKPSSKKKQNQHLNNIYKNNKQTNKRPSSAINTSSTRKNNIKEQIKQEQQYESDQFQDYQSDFESMSIANSAIRSHTKSLKKQQVAVDESIRDSQYGQDFQSFSQSQFNNQYKQQHLSYSEISESIKSLSQSYRK